MTTHRYTIAITGAHGLLGSGVIRHALSLGHSVLALDRTPLSFPPSSHLFDPHAPPAPPDSANGDTDNLEPCGSGITPLDRSLLVDSVAAHRHLYAYRNVDLLDYSAFRTAVKEGGCDALVHLAAVYRQHDGYGNYLEGGLAEHVSQGRKVERKELMGQEVYNTNTTMSYNALSIAAELGIERVVMASSVNSIGMLFSREPRFDYLPMDEAHPYYPEDAYSLAKQTSKIQASAMIQRNPSLSLRFASLRFHWVVPTPLCTKDTILDHPGSHKDLWGWVSVSAASRAVVSAITAPLERFPAGHEVFLIVARIMCGGKTRADAVRGAWDGVEWRGGEMGNGNEGMFDTSKAERMLGWAEEGYPGE